MTTTCSCGEPIDGATLCARCTKTLAIAIANVSAHHADLDTLRAKLARYSATGHKTTGSRETPIPVDGRFTDPIGTGSQVAADTRNTCVAWTREVLDANPPMPQPGPVCRKCGHDSCETYRRRRHPRDTVQAMCGYLLGWVDRMRTHVDGPMMLDEFTDLERRLARLVDRPAERWYAGICSAPIGDDEHCPAEVYARADRGHIECQECGEQHDVQARREYLLGEAENVLATASEAARAVTVWSDYDRGETRLVRRISDWQRRKRIETRGHVEELGRMRPTYRIGDILDLLADDARRESA